MAIKIRKGREAINPGRKQRLVKLTAAERSINGIPDVTAEVDQMVLAVPETMRLKSNEPGQPDQFRESLWSLIRQYKHGLQARTMEPREVREQARETADITRELFYRMWMHHPDLNHIFAPMFPLMERPEWGEFIDKLETFEPGKRTNPRDTLLSGVVILLQRHVTPKPKISDARAVAAKMLSAIGVDVPTDVRTLRRSAKAK